jgi:hypothetical protein
VARLLDENRHVLGGVPWRVQQPARDVADRQRFAVRRLAKRKLQIGARSGQHGGAEAGELARAGHEIGMDVRLDRIGDRQAVPIGEARIRIDVASRIDDCRFARTRTGDEIGALCEPFVREPLKHEVKSSQSES